MAARFVHLQLTDASRRVIARHAGALPRLGRNLAAAHAQGLDETVQRVRRNRLNEKFVRGESAPSDKRRRRSGQLADNVTRGVDAPLDGWAGVPSGTPASAYAATQLTDGATTIKPVDATYLWIPLGFNLTNKGMQRMSPTEAREKTKTRKRKTKGRTGPVQLLRIIKSKAGNLIAMLPGEVVPGVRRNGLVPMFALKKQVTVHGADVIGDEAQDMRPRFTELYSRAIIDAVGGD